MPVAIMDIFIINITELVIIPRYLDTINRSDTQIKFWQCSVKFYDPLRGLNGKLSTYTDLLIYTLNNDE